MLGKKPTVVSELKSLLDAFPAARREQVIAAMREAFREITAEWEGERGQAIAEVEACEARGGIGDSVMSPLRGLGIVVRPTQG